MINTTVSQVTTGTRFQTIDSLRGIAALSVLFYHLSINLQPWLSMALPHFLTTAFQYGFIGVPIFFVISGLVISLSIGDNRITPKYAGNFILRRSIRLDPTYWACIILGIILTLVKSKAMGVPADLPSTSGILLHFVYLQDIFNVSPVISVVYWTLCLEVQFYLFYLFSLWLAQRVIPFKAHGHVLLIFAVGLLSILAEKQQITLPFKGTFIPQWHYFLIGVFLGNIFRTKKFSFPLFMIWLAVEVGFAIKFDIKPFWVAGIASSVIILLLWKGNKLNSWLCSRVFQYLGKISYTLYLIHPDIGWKFISIGKLALVKFMSPSVSVLLFIAAVLVSILSAHIIHVIFEAPSLRLTNKLKTLSLKEALGFSQNRTQ